MTLEPMSDQQYPPDTYALTGMCPSMAQLYTRQIQIGCKFWLTLKIMVLVLFWTFLSFGNYVGVLPPKIYHISVGALIRCSTTIIISREQSKMDR